MTTQRELDRIGESIAELLETHNSRRDLAELRAYWDDPIGFMDKELNFRPYAKQREVIEAFVNNKRVVVRGCHGAGKDAVLGALAMWCAYVRGMLVLCLCATEKQLLNQLWREVGNRFSVRLPGELYTSDLRIDGKKRVIAMTAGATSVSQLTGWHDANGVAVMISEGQAESVGDGAFDAAESNTIDDKSKIIVVGNPINPLGRFFDVHSKASWVKIRMSAFDHPNIIEGREVVPGGPAQSWVDECATGYGSESAFYLARVLAEFPDTAVDSLIARSWIVDANHRHDSEQHQEWRETQLWKGYVLGVDVARYGSDKSAVAIVRGPHVEKIVTWSGKSTTETAALVIEIAEQHRVSIPVTAGTRETFAPRICCDDVGVGGGVVDELRRRQWNVIAFNGGATAWRSHPAKYLNLRADAAFYFRELLEKRNISLPRDEELKEEALACEYQLTAKGMLQLLSKDDIRKAIKRSPDKLDAVVQALAVSMGGLSRAPQRFNVSI